MALALTILAGYLLGSVPIAVLVARRHGVDLHAVGDRNPGAWNALEQLGRRRAWPVFVGDGLKGTLAGVLGWGLTGEATGAYAGVGAAMLGHALPVFDRFRGGKSVMTFGGGAFALSPLAAGLALAACGAATAARDFATGARIGIFGFPVVQLAFDPVERVMATGALMTFIGLLFLLGRRRSGPARSSADGPSTA